MATQIEWVQQVRKLVEAVEDARTEAIVMTGLPLGLLDQTTVGDSDNDRACIVFDHYQGQLVYALLHSADNIDELLDYIQFAANDVKRQGTPVVVPEDRIGALTQPDVSVHWSIHPDIYFAAQKQTL